MILLISPLPPPAGGDSTWSVRYMEYCRTENIPIRHVNTAVIGKRASSINGASNLIHELWRAWRIWRAVKFELRTGEIDAVHFNTNCSPKGLVRDVITLKIISRYRKPVAVHCRCNVPDQIGESAVGMSAFKHLTKLATVFIALNDISLRFIESFGAKAVIIPNFIRPEEIIAEKNISETVAKVVFVGHVISTKGISEIIDAAGSMPDIQFNIVGPVGMEYTTITLPSNVHFLGAINHREVRSLLDESDVFLFPSYTEGFSNALMEAMARGMPIIATDVGAANDMLESKGGILIKPRNPALIVDALDSLSTKTKRETMSRWNIRKVREAYTIDTVMGRLLSVYSHLAQRHV